ncbi:hypothetical protein DESUT3_21020 [Desulfuromonas versatilis]|uniref:Lipid A biosynthesis N-terminal domain-containing protein n=1 Tax=Desulfuromonas versatilis TaxID=2802975 RepID=A0ABN6DY36_9BACT|nr:lipid-A-disaccharide synthase N-terminal domain-containing protein [Desulfuromonas versatilis]BCR05033.1 hypothetical protein DESUT3_21020 [Desulfuromonas versatilis]
MSKAEIGILTLGFSGQALFFMRFFIQWIHSERHRRSIIPVAFWYFSLGGSSLLLIYAIIRRDLVFIVGQSTGFFIYTRNLYLIHREKSAQDSPQPGQGAQE